MFDNFIITKINRVILVDKYEYPETKTSFTNDLSYNELIFNFSGSSTVTFNGKTFHCTPDTIRFLPKGKNDEYTVVREGYGECIDVFFDTDIPVSDEMQCFNIQDPNTVKNLFKKIFAVWVGKNDGFYFESISLLYSIFSEIQKHNYISNEQYNLIKPAIRYIEENFLSTKISIEKLSNLCGISESYLKRLFIKKFGIPPIKYIIQLKTNYASDLLRSNMYSLEQVAHMCNYDNYYYFSRQFKNYVGLSPKNFADKYKSSK